MSAQDEGRLVLVGTPIGNLGDLSPRAVEALRAADVVAAEDTRRARALMSAAQVESGGRLLSVHGHNEARAAGTIGDEVAAGKIVAYVSEAGMPAISDPGARLVSECVERGLRVEVVPGPSAALTALVLSGLPTDHFHFEGFLPRKGRARAARVAQAARSGDTVVLFESPIRAAATLSDLAAACGPERPAAVARELTKLHEEVTRATLGELAESAQREGVRGEVVIVVGGAAEDEPATDEQVAAAAADALAAGRSGRDAAKEVAERLGVSRRRAYAAVVRARSGDA